MGSTWTAQYSGSVSAVHAISTTAAWAVGYNGLGLKTTNAGATWTPVSVSTTNALYDVFFTDASHGWMVSDNKTILHTSDGGATWITQNSGLANNSVFNQVQFLNNFVGYIRNSETMIIHSKPRTGAQPGRCFPTTPLAWDIPTEYSHVRSVPTALLDFDANLGGLGNGIHRLYALAQDQADS